MTFAFAGCGDKPAGVNSSLNGVYYLTDESYEKIIRDEAKRYGLGEDWVRGVLDGGDGGDYSIAVCPKEQYYCVVVDNGLNCVQGVGTLYSLEADGDEYKCSPKVESGARANCRFQNGLLSLTIGEEVLSFERNDAYELREQPQKLASLAPSAREEVSNDGRIVTFFWNYKSEYGNSGMAIEIKKATDSEYKTVKVEYWYYNMYVAEFRADDFEYGKNYIRLYNLGTPAITRDNEIVVYQNSDYTEYCFEKNSDNSLTFSKI